MKLFPQLLWLYPSSFQIFALIFILPNNMGFHRNFLREGTKSPHKDLKGPETQKIYLKHLLTFKGQGLPFAPLLMPKGPFINDVTLT